MKILKFSLTLLLFSSILACNPEKTKQEAVLQGQLKEISNQEIYLKELDIRETYNIDSVKTSADGSFKISFEIANTGFYMLYPKEDYNIVLVISPGENITINGDFTDYNETFTVSGSPESELFAAYMKHTRANETVADSLINVLKQYRDDPAFEIVREQHRVIFDSLFEDQKKYVREFVKKNPGNLSSLLVLNRRFGQIPMFSEKNDFEYFQMIDSALMISYPDNKHSLDHHERVKEIIEAEKEKQEALKKLMPGNKLPEIILDDTSKNKIALSSLRGKYVLVYFWAAWNASARQSIPKVKALYEKYKSNDFEIYAVSFDSFEKMWKGAIKLDQMNWINVSDLQNVHSPVFELFRLPEQMPYYYLIDKEGIILYRGSNLNLVEEILKEKL